MKRRRFLAITAAAGALAASPARAFRLDPVEWRGTALGAVATLTIHHEDRREAEALLAASLAELERLERIFSLYRDESALVRLNRAGRLDAPPADLLALLSEAGRVWHLSEGAFDVTVQPLWQATANHFAAPGADPAGPRLDALRPLVGWDKVVLNPASVSFSRSGMGLTLNGIAQGYVTDKVAELLRAHGMRHVLVGLGEVRAVGGRGDGRPWRAALPSGGRLDLQDEALAVSWANATRFSPSCHHLFDPHTARSAPVGPPVIIRAPTATLADAASTACAVAPALAERVLAGLGCRRVV